MAADVELTQGWTAPIRFDLQIDSCHESLTTANQIIPILKTRRGTPVTMTGDALLVTTSTSYNAILNPDPGDFHLNHSPYTLRFKLVDTSTMISYYPSGRAVSIEVFPE